MSSDTKKTTTEGADATKKITREEKLRAAKMDESIEKVIRSLGRDLTPEAKLAKLAQNYIEMERENHRLTTSIKNNDRLFLALTREKENILREYNKGVLIKDKLEQVCREQQKLIKTVKSESMQKIKEEEEKRIETQAKLQQSINEIFVTLNKNNEENEKLKDVNVNITKKLKYLTEQYGIREKQLEQINEQVKLETQLNDAKMAKVQMESNMEKEKVLRQNEATLQELLKCKKNLNDMAKREGELKSQLALYTEKYDMFQTSLQKSNSLFTDYKTEITKISKNNRTLEKECIDYKRKYEKSHAALLNMATDKHQQDQEIARSSRQLAQLQKLCRTLQAERTSLLDVLKENNIDRPPMPELPPEPIVPTPAVVDPISVKTAKIDELKGVLAQIQGQMNELTAVKKEETTGGKGKKNKKKQGKSSQSSVEKEDIQEKNVKNGVAESAIEKSIVKDVETSGEVHAEQKIVENANVNVKSEDSKTVTAEAPPKALNGSELTDGSAKVNAENDNNPTVASGETVLDDEAAKKENMKKIMINFLDVLANPNKMIEMPDTLEDLEEDSNEEDTDEIAAAATQ